MTILTTAFIETERASMSPPQMSTTFDIEVANGALQRFGGWVEAPEPRQ